MTLRNRLQEIYGKAPQPPSNGLRTQLERMEQRRRNGLPASMAEVLGGDWIRHERGQVLSVEKRFPLSHCHGRIPLQQFLKLRSEFVRLLSGDPAFEDFSPQSFLFLDTETTGLSGGAGTYVFLIGVGYIEGTDFCLRQFFLPDYSSERAFLQELASVIDGVAGPSPNTADSSPAPCPSNAETDKPQKALEVPPHRQDAYVTLGSGDCNGPKPLKQASSPRVAQASLPVEGGTAKGQTPEVSSIGPSPDPSAGRRPPVAGFRPPFRQLVSFNGKSYDLNLLANRFILQRLGNPLEGMQHLDLIHPCRTLWRGRFENCALQTLERQVLQFVRDGDIPSAEIPQTYFRFLRSGSYRPFREVFEHNRLDILSMVGLAAVASSVIEDPAAHDFADPLSAARLHQLRGNLAGAAAILGKALKERNGAPDRPDWLRELALLEKRLGRPARSLSLWKEYLRCHASPGQEAFEECAKILEHQRKDFEKALRTVELGLRSHPANPALSHRRHRLECKIAGKRWW